jgi:hypothetical protein
MYDLKIVDRISHDAEIRNILLKYKIKWRKSKAVLSNKRNNDLAEYDLKKSIFNSKDTTHIYWFSVTIWRWKGTNNNSKDHWWFVIGVINTGKDREGSKDKRAAKNVFGAYYHTNDKMHVQCYKKKTGKQFVDFLKRVERRYDKDILKNIFLVLDNLSSVHKSKKVKGEISKSVVLE